MTESKIEINAETNRISRLSDASKASLPDDRFAQLERRIEKMMWLRDEKSKEVVKLQSRIQALEDYLGISEKVTAALDQLSQKLFNETLEILQEKLTIALQEVLEQPILFKATPAFKKGSAVVEFSIEKDGHSEDLLRGQGGSVHNVLSVGLRLFALEQTLEAEHRRFLVLDEQDCWLRPELVPKLMRLIYFAARELEFQVIVISHHDVNLFREYADRIYRLEPGPDGIEVDLVHDRQTDEPV